MTTAKKDTRNRSFDMTIDIAATRDAVWDALTQASELVRWFPLEAEVIPGPGGRVRFGWGGAWASDARIDAWEPERRLRLIETREPYDVAGNPRGESGSQQLAMEFTLETHGGTTRLRLVHSGFGTGRDWDDEIDGVSAGWQHELRSLRHYLERHRGRDRHAVWIRGATPLDLSAAWARLTGPGGFAFDDGLPIEGAKYSVTPPGGERFTGVVQFRLPDWDFAGTVDQLHDGIFRLSTYRARDTGVMAWLASYDPSDRARVDEFGAQAQRAFDSLFTPVRT